MRRILPTLLLITLCSPALAGVYKRVDDQGNVEYTDLPQTAKEKSIPLPASTTYSSTPVDSGTQTSGPAAPPISYESIVITQPKDDEAVRENAGILEVKITCTPELRPDHQFAVLIDGKKMKEGRSNTLQVNDVERGSHTLLAEIVDADGKILASSHVVTFHMQRVSILQQKGTEADSPYTTPEPYQSPSPYQMPEPYQAPSPYQLPAPYRPAPK